MVHWCILCIMVAAVSVVLFLMWFLILKITLLHIYTWPEIVYYASDVAEFITIKMSVIQTSVWAWLLPHVALKIQWQHKQNPIFVRYDLSLNTLVPQTETLKSYWNDMCNHSLRLCAGFRISWETFTSGPSVLRFKKKLTFFDIVTVMLLSSQSWWREEHYCR